MTILTDTCMNITFGNVVYQTDRFDDRKAGCAGLNLLATLEGETTRVGRITFWDALGQFFMELKGDELPLEVVEKFIAEAKEQISTS